MNKRANLYLNIFEMLSFVLTACFMESFLYFHASPFYIKYTLLLFTIISGIVFISVEIFLFLLLKNISKAIYIVYVLIDLAVTAFLTIQIPFSGFAILLLFSVIKNALRIVLVKEIYLPKEFNRYCKMFGITVSDFKKTRKRTKKETRIKITATEKTKKTTKKKTTTKKKVQEEATI